MNIRLMSLMAIVAGCVATVYSQLDRESKAQQYQALLATPCTRPSLPSAEPGTDSPAPVIAPPPIINTAENIAPPEESFEDQVRKNPYAVAEKTEALPPGYDRLTTLNRVATAWANLDPATALTWARQLSDPAERVAVTSTALLAWGQSDPRKAISYAESCDLGDQTCSTMGILVQKLADTDLNSALAYVSQQPAGALKDELLSRVVMVEAASDPLAAGQTVSQCMVPGPAQTEAAISIVHQWAMKDPDAAAGWAADFPEGPLKDRALNEINGLASYRQPR